LRVPSAAVDPTRVAEGVEMSMVHRIAAFTFTAAAVLFMQGGCVAPEDIGALQDEEDEDAEEADAALRRSDRDGPQGGTEPRDPDAGCMASCRGAFDGCVANCSMDRPNCISYCHDAYRDCVRSSCGYGGNRGGCNSLNSADCNPWWDWGNP
jgi:hypothetical protein